MLIISFFVAGANLFIYCYFGQKATNSFDKITDYLFEFDWLKLPVSLRAYLIPTIANAQRPMYYHGFGVAILSLQTFNKVNIIIHSLSLI